MVISRRSLLLAGAAFPASAFAQCVINAPAVDACLGGVRNAGPAGATLDLNFMFPGTLDPRVTFSRASTATYTDASGVIQTAAVNQPRWDYAGGSLRGLLIEEARTNLLLNSATLVTQSVAVTAQAYTLSFYGTGTITKSGAATGALVGTGAGQRVSQTFTPTAGTLTCTVTGSVLNAQIEAGGFATSWISTAGAAAARTDEFCAILAANMTPWFVAPGGSWFAEFISISPLVASSYRRVIGINDVPGITPITADNTASLIGQYEGGSVFSANAITVGAVSKAATTWAPGAARACLNGGAVASSAGLAAGYSGLAASGVRFLTNSTPTEGMNGVIRRVQYWPRALSNAEMQQVTA